MLSSGLRKVELAWARVFLLAAVAFRALAETPGADIRVVRHARGEARVSGRAVRVVTLTNEGTEAAVALGLTPVGAVRSWTQGRGDWYPHLGGLLRGVRLVGDEEHPDLAAVGELRPDLVLGNALRQGGLYESLAAIAPTVFSETLRGDWQRNLALYADALGRTAEARALLADWESRVASARASLPRAKDTRVAVVRFLPGAVRICHERTFSGSLLAELAFARAPFAAANDFFEPLPFERLRELSSADAIFYFTWDEGDGRALERERTWTSSAAWRALPAVAAARAFRVDDGVWNSAGGILAARQVLLEATALLGQGPQRQP